MKTKKINGRRKLLKRRDGIVWRIPGVDFGKAKLEVVPVPFPPEQFIGFNNRDNLRRYLREVAQTPLLTPTEEVTLANRIKRGDKMAREQMIKANLRLVVKIAKNYGHLGLPLLDLINEGNIGLMKAVDRFDPGKGAKLSTYSGWWIRQHIRRAVTYQGKTIRLPVHIADKIFRLERAEMRLHSDFGREPTDRELAKKLGVEIGKIDKLRKFSTPVTSMECPIGENETPFGNTIVDENAENPAIALEENDGIKLIRELIATKLTSREAKIVGLRFGLNGDDWQTLECIGKRFGLTRERIRQIQNTAEIKLKHWVNLANGEKASPLRLPRRKKRLSISSRTH